MDDDDEDTASLTDQRVFGAGIKRNPVKFVLPERVSPQSLASVSNGAVVADLYRSIVLPQGRSIAAQKNPNSPHDQNELAGSSRLEDHVEEALCQICRLPLQSPKSLLATVSNPHEASLVHQACLDHSHPPSHLDRSRKGLEYLSSYGWDPDSRLGLGATGNGRLAPVRGKLKNDTLGVGFEEKLRKTAGRTVSVEKKAEKLNAKKVRKLEAEGRRKRARLQEMFYGGDEVQRYLGLGG